VSGGLLGRVVCAECAGALDVTRSVPACGACGATYARVGAIPVRPPRASAHVEVWRRQLGAKWRRDDAPPRVDDVTAPG
jgi:hypothetical protein